MDATSKDSDKRECLVRPAPAVADLAPYRPPRHPAPAEYRLDGNEGAVPPPTIIETLKPLLPGVIRNYPDRSELESLIAQRYGVPASRVLVTAGGDEALERALRIVLARGRELILPVPTFQMIERYAVLCRATITEVPWDGSEYPIEKVMAAVKDDTAAIVVVSPNNPTGAVIRPEYIERLSKWAPRTLIVVDLAYIEFADQDITDYVLSLPNTVAVRTMSKVWGMAGLRVGYALAQKQVISWMRAVGNPYTVAGTSLALARHQLEEDKTGVDAFVQRVREERSRLQCVLKNLGEQPEDSQGNFVFLKSRRALWIWESLGGLGIAIRRFDDDARLADSIRITCPGNPDVFAALMAAVECALAPECLVLQLDQVLAAASPAYLAAAIEAGSGFGVPREKFDMPPQAEGMPAACAALQRALERHGRRMSAAEVWDAYSRTYERLLQQEGSAAAEQLTCGLELLQRLAGRVKLTVLTLRPSAQARAFLAATGLENFISGIVSAEDIRPGAASAAIRLALERACCRRGWFIGSEREDLRAARIAGVIPVAVRPAAEPPELLLQAGAARIMESLNDLQELVP